MSASLLISLGAASIAFGLGWIGVSGIRVLRRRSKIRRRVSPLADLLVSEAPEAAAPLTRKQEQTNKTDNPLFRRLDARYPLQGGLRTALIGCATALLASMVTAPVLSFFGLQIYLAIMAAGFVGIAVGWGIASMLEANKRNEFTARFLIILEDFHRMVRYGIASQQAIRSITEVAEEPAKTSLRKIMADAEFGVPIGAAMDLEARRIRVSELSMLAAVISTQTATGGNLSESVANLAAMVRERLDNRSRIKASTAESRITMIILAIVPLAAIGLQTATQPELIGVLLGEARHLFGIGVVLILLGLVFSWMIIRSAQR